MVNKSTKIIILAGGKGKRFNPFSFVIPKTTYANQPKPNTNVFNKFI